MFFKDDWDITKERFNAFWAGEILDRCCFAVSAPRNIPLETGIEYHAAESLVQKWLDPEYRYKEAIHYFSHTYFGGDAFPLFWNNLGPGVGASFIGPEYKLAENTVWFDGNPIIKDWDKMPEIAFNQNSEMWKILCDMAELFCKRAGNDYMVGLTDFGGTYDIAVSLRGNDNLLYDLYDYPEEVKALAERIDGIWMQAYTKHYDQIKQHVDGTAAWMGMWCNKRWFPIQADFSAMISSKMFDEFIVPSLNRQANFLDYAVYHLDGPGQIRHLDSLLAMENIIGIQCVPGSALFKNTGEFHPTFCNDIWIPVLKKIQNKGKNLILNEVHPSELDQLMEVLSPKGLFISTSCKTEDYARDLLKKIEKWR